jgi:hypothetical protein
VRAHPIDASDDRRLGCGTYSDNERGVTVVPPRSSGANVSERLVEDPLVPERVIDGGLPLAVLPVS